MQKYKTIENFLLEIDKWQVSVHKWQVWAITGKRLLGIENILLFIIWKMQKI